MHFIVLSSSRGTTFQAIIDALRDRSLTATCLGLVTDQPNRECIEKAKASGIPVSIVEKRKGESREEYDRRLDEAIRSLGDVDVIAAIGWMFVLTSWCVAQWKSRILNVHPALLPKHSGKGMYGMRVHEAVLRAHDKETGMTIHLMDEDVDTGPVLLQKTCEVLPGDTPEILRARVQELEKEWYPKVLQMIEEGEIRL
jgi:phosphoribosylglycinamide formyltransferase 1